MWRMLLLAGISMTAAIGGEHPVWVHDYQAALQRSQTERKLVFAFFSGAEWCSATALFREKILASRPFLDYVNSRFVLLELDYPEPQRAETESKGNRQLRERFKVAAFPTVLVLDSSGALLVRTGYFPSSPEEYTARLEQQLKTISGGKNEPNCGNCRSGVNPDGSTPAAVGSATHAVPVGN